MGTEYSHSHAASLAVMLPDESCIKRTINPALKWTQTEWMLYSIEYSLRWLRWAKTKDASHKRNMPKPMQTPDEQAKIENKIKN